MTTDRSAFLLNGDRFQIPAGTAGQDLLQTIDHQVPRRSAGRRSAHRERFCLVALLNALMTSDPHLFPAFVDRAESPDFLLTCANGDVVAIEHTDAGEQEYQRFLAEMEEVDAPVSCPSPNGAAWIGDQPERAFLAAIEAAIARKSAERIWTNAPREAKRWLLMYDQTNTGLFIYDEPARQFLGIAAGDAEKRGFALQRAMLVRGQGRILQWQSEGQDQ